MTGGPSIVFTREAVVNEKFIRSSRKKTKSTIGIDASQLYSYSKSQDTQTGLFTRYILTPIYRISRPYVTKIATLRIGSYLFTRKQDLNKKKESLFTSEKRKKIDQFFVDGYCDQCNTVLQRMGFYYHFFSCQEAHLP